MLNNKSEIIAIVENTERLITESTAIVNKIKENVKVLKEMNIEADLVITEAYSAVDASYDLKKLDILRKRATISPEELKVKINKEWKSEQTWRLISYMNGYALEKRVLAVVDSLGYPVERIYISKKYETLDEATLDVRSELLSDTLDWKSL